MKKKIIWVLVSSLMVLSLIMASCGPAEEEAEVEIEEGEVTIEGEEEEEVEEEVVEEEGLLPPEVPKYGGIYTYVTMGDIRGFDPVKNLSMDCTANHFAGGMLMMGDWAKGPAGTNEIEWWNGFCGRVDVWAGSLAESWEIPDENTIIWNIRQGVYFHDKYPVNGRELDAFDAEYCLNRTWFAEGAYHPTSVDPDAIPTSIKALDKWTVEMKVPAKQLGMIWLLTGPFSWIYPHEVIDVYGDMTDWKTLVGMGPYMLTDYVTGSLVTYRRNPNYWQHDPFHPENQLPYLDAVKAIIIPDKSTQLAAMRTGKVDKLTGVTWEDGEMLLQQCPDLKYVTRFGGVSFPWGRQDKPELPFDDLRVRRAMNMAVNQQEIIDEYYEGNAVMLGWPFLPMKAYEPWYTPLEEMPEAVQELYTYNPTKARQLLTDAGYPDGFKTIIQCGSESADFLSIIKEYLADVNIDLEIQPMEGGAFYGIIRGRNHKEMIYKFATTHWPARMLEVRIESFDNHAFFESPVTRETYNTICKNYFNADIVDQQLREYGPFVLEQALAIWLPVPYAYHLWWPWVQNYHGEQTMGFVQGEFFVYYIWVDEALKNSMGY